MSPRYFNNPLVKIPKTDWEKRKLAEMIQVSRQMMANKPIDLTPRLTFGEAACGEMLRDAEGHYRPAIIARARQTLIEHNLTPPSNSVDLFQRLLEPLHDDRSTPIEVFLRSGQIRLQIAVQRLIGQLMGRQQAANPVQITVEEVDIAERQRRPQILRQISIRPRLPHHLARFGIEQRSTLPPRSAANVRDNAPAR